ncbi:glycosyltransferase [Polynucleobacter sp. IMCC30063]|uniref:glycosyltransferase family 2 protein n=1 Tax=Polynucleobacter sp. IMCC30063 TaxID=2907298 RepID=UPI001F401A40|nr:glycosyltransferase family 2 protein [Polynucleobacter sp. IMCC30063]MCE7505285.1 glycosyltransferase [Polynucleobacter sp. IMCC30063]
MKILSVIIPIFNSFNDLKNLEKCLNKIKIKDQVIEFIIIDDCSEPLFFQALLNCAKKYHNWYIYKSKKNAGPGNARNIGIEKAQGCYVTFLDADDVIKVNNVDKLVNNLINLRKNRADVVSIKKINYSRTKEKQIIDYLETEEKIAKKDWLKFFIDNENVKFECWGWIIRKDFLLKHSINFKNLKYGEDQEFMVQIFANLNLLYFLRGIEYIHNSKSGGLSTRFKQVNIIYQLVLLATIVNQIESSSNKLFRFFLRKILEDIAQSFYCYLFAFNSNLNNKLLKDVEKITKKINLIIPGSSNGYKRLKLLLENLLLIMEKNMSRYIYIYCLSEESMCILKRMEKYNFKRVKIIDDAKKGLFQRRRIINFDKINYSLRDYDPLVIISHRNQDIQINIKNKLILNGLNEENIYTPHYHMD